MKRTNRRLLATIGRTYSGPARRDAPTEGGGTEGGATSKPADPNDAAKGGDAGGDGTKKPELKGEYDADRALADLGKARDDAKREKEARQKAEADQTAKMDAVLIALGLKPDPNTDPAATAAKVAKELTDANARVSELTIENALLRLADKAGADTEALRDSRSFMKDLAELDPSAKDFETSVATAIKAAVKANPKLAKPTGTGQGAGRMGADMSGGANNGSDRPKSLREAFSRKANS